MKNIQVLFKDYLKKKMKRIKHNNLLPWFTQDHGTLPASYLASCEKFFRELKNPGVITAFQEAKAASSKHQASSSPAGQPEVEKNKKRFDKLQAVKY